MCVDRFGRLTKKSGNAVVIESDPSSTRHGLCTVFRPALFSDKRNEVNCGELFLAVAGLARAREPHKLLCGLAPDRNDEATADREL